MGKLDGKAVLVTGASRGIGAEIARLKAGLAATESDRDRVKGLYEGLASASDAAGRATATGLTPKPAIDVSSYQSKRLFATARDGTRVPYVVIHKKGLKLDGNTPAWISAYGSYGLPAYTPAFAGTIVAAVVTIAFADHDKGRPVGRVRPFGAPAGQGRAVAAPPGPLAVPHQTVPAVLGRAISGRRGQDAGRDGDRTQGRGRPGAGVSSTSGSRSAWPRGRCGPGPRPATSASTRRPTPHVYAGGRSS